MHIYAYFLRAKISLFINFSQSFVEIKNIISKLTNNKHYCVVQSWSRGVEHKTHTTEPWRTKKKAANRDLPT
jgi:hypothetical protein